MRYQVCVFPSLHGTPWYTNHWWIARLYAWWRNTGVWEVRIIDSKTGEHYVW